MKKLISPLLWAFTAAATLFLIITGYAFYSETLKIFSGEGDGNTLVAGLLSMSIELTKLVATHLAIQSALRGEAPRLGYLGPALIFVALSFVAHYINTRAAPTTAAPTAQAVKLDSLPTYQAPPAGSAAWQHTTAKQAHAKAVEAVNASNAQKMAAAAAEKADAEAAAAAQAATALEARRKGFFLMLIFELVQLLLIAALADLEKQPTQPQTAAALPYTPPQPEEQPQGAASGQKQQEPQPINFQEFKSTLRGGQRPPL